MPFSISTGITPPPPSVSAREPAPQVKTPETGVRSVRQVERHPRRSLRGLAIRYRLASLFGRVKVSPPAVQRHLLNMADGDAAQYASLVTGKLGARLFRPESFLMTLYDTVGEAGRPEQKNFDENFLSALDENLKGLDDKQIYRLHKRLRGALRDYPAALTAAADNRGQPHLAHTATRLAELDEMVTAHLAGRGYTVPSRPSSRGQVGAKTSACVNRFADQAKERLSTGMRQFKPGQLDDIQANLNTILSSKEHGSVEPLDKMYMVDAPRNTVSLEMPDGRKINNLYRDSQEGTGETASMGATPETSRRMVEHLREFCDGDDKKVHELTALLTQSVVGATVLNMTTRFPNNAGALVPLPPDTEGGDVSGVTSSAYVVRHDSDRGGYIIDATFTQKSSSVLHDKGVDYLDGKKSALQYGFTVYLPKEGSAPSVERGSMEYALYR